MLRGCWYITPEVPAVSAELMDRSTATKAEKVMCFPISACLVLLKLPAATSSLKTSLSLCQLPQNLLELTGINSSFCATALVLLLLIPQPTANSFRVESVSDSSTYSP